MTDPEGIITEFVADVSEAVKKHWGPLANEMGFASGHALIGAQIPLAEDPEIGSGTRVQALRRRHEREYHCRSRDPRRVGSGKYADGHGYLQGNYT